MKKFLSVLIISLFALVAIPASASAAPVATIVLGKVTKSGGAAVSGANVTVTCNSATENATTNGAGRYSVSFDPGDCPDGAVATANVTSSDGSGSNSGTVENGTIGQSETEINVAVVDVQVAVPEMGAVVGGIAAIGAGGAFLIVRKRQQQHVDQA